MISALQGGIKRYSWGSLESIQQLCELEQDGQPIAEIWFGAHASAPSMLSDGATLDTVVAADPHGELGNGDESLRFLVKLLAANEALSIQLHPDAAAAAEGFARQNAAGIPVDDLLRTYRDGSHKPEVVYPLTEFAVLAGLQSNEQMRFSVDAFGLDPIIADVLNEHGRVELLSQILDPATPQWVTRSLGALQRLDLDSIEDQRLRHAEALLEIAAGRPDDPGLLVASLMNHQILAPGEAMFVDAGCLHAYLHGFAVEVMASSDNVIRGGLTNKYIDVAELVRLVDPRSEPVIMPAPGDGVALPIPVSEFDMRSFRTGGGDDGMTLPTGTAHILLCLTESVTIRDSRSTTSLTLRPGEAAWVSANEHVTFAGNGHTVVVSSTTRTSS